MLILGVDTSGRNGSLALCLCGRDDSGGCQVLELASLAGGTYSAKLVPQLAAMLKRQRLDKTAIEGFAVASGPGSFTGLRVGLSAVKALGETLQKPIAAVSVLEAVAWQAQSTGRAKAALDAGRGQVYVGEYEWRDHKPRCLRESLLTVAELLAAGDAGQGPIFTPDESVVSAVRSQGQAGTLVAQPRADLIARIGWQKIADGETVPVDLLDANYIRRSDAEIFSLPKLQR